MFVENVVHEFVELFVVRSVFAVRQFVRQRARHVLVGQKARVIRGVAQAQVDGVRFVAAVLVAVVVTAAVLMAHKTGLIVSPHIVGHALSLASFASRGGGFKIESVAAAAQLGNGTHVVIATRQNGLEFAHHAQNQFFGVFRIV